MTVWFVTGGLGSGKGLAGIGKIFEYACAGLKIAGNLDVNLDHLCNNPLSKVNYIRIPDRPTAFDLECLGSGNDGYNEDENSLLVLDELMTWMNSRTWNDKGRAAVLDWLVHSRKHGWDVLIMVQSIETVDKQLIESLMDYHVPMSDLSKVNIPFIGRLGKSFNKRGKPLKLPKIHVGTLLYKNKVKADKWYFRNRHLYKAYDTKQIFTENYPNGAHTQLSRYHLEGRYLEQKKLTSIYLKIGFYALCFIAFKLTKRPTKTLLNYLSRPLDNQFSIQN
jgi:hypothetical protein